MSDATPSVGLDVLLIEDNPGDARLIEEMLWDAEKLRERVDTGTTTGERTGIHHVDRLEDGLERLRATTPDVVLLDLGLPDSTGLDTLSAVVDAGNNVPIIVFTGLRDEQVGIEAIQRGAQDYLIKDDVTSDLLVRSIHHAIERNRQERERARRRDQLESLNTLTRDLMDAETAGEASDRVIAAADAMAALPVAVVALYEDGALVPAGMTAGADEVLDVDALLDPTDGDAWQAFVEDDGPRRLADSPACSPPVTEVTVFSLARQGVLVAGSTDPGGFDATNVDFVETVAGNVETALERVAREQQLQEREQLLEQQNQTLERLNRVNDIIRNIAQALVQASSREEIESVVCEQLADVGPYELAWVGEHDELAGEIVPREWDGSGKGYVEGLTIDATEGPEAEGPTAQAVTSREPQTVNDILGDRAYEPWRQTALNRGFHSSIALPLVYEDALYGVLNVYAGQPDVFDDLEGAVLVELADTIAYAINAVESKKALVGHEVTRLEFAITDGSLGFVEVSRDLECEIAVENLVPRSDGGIRCFFTTRGASPDAIETSSRLPVRDLSLISEYEEAGDPVCLFEAELTDASVVATVLEHGGRPGAIEVSNGTASVTVELAADATVREFVDMFQTRYPESTLVSQYTHEQPRQSPTELRASLTETLTDRQLEALQTAYFSGFFETPRKRTETQIADSMDIAQPTFNRHLRTAQQKLCERLFHDQSLDG